MKKTIILFLITIMAAAIFAFGPTKPIYFQIKDSNGNTPAEGTVTFSAYLEDYSSDVITQASYGCDYHLYRDVGDPVNNIGLISLDCGSFANDIRDMFEFYSGSQVVSDYPMLHLEFTMTEVRETESINVLIDDDALQVFVFDGENWEMGEPLPVTLSSFTATYLDGNSILQWVTQSENNNAGWNVYRSETKLLSEAWQANPELIPGYGTCTEPKQYIFEDSEIEAEMTYNYWLESLDYSGYSETYGPIVLQTPAGESNDTPEVPIVYGLHAAYPNPFNPETTIQFVLKEPAAVELAIYNIKGQKVVMLFDDFVYKVDEPVSVYWDGKDASGKDTGSGIYFYRFNTTGRTQIKKMVLVK